MIRNHFARAGRYAAANARRGLLIAGFGAALAGCQTPQDTPTGIWSDYRLRHPIAIVEKNRTMQVMVGSARHGLTPDQRADVLAFAQTWRQEGTGTFVINQPSNVRNARAASAALAEIRSLLHSAGIPAGAIRVQSYRVADPNMLAVIQINYPQLSAQVSNCGQWPDDLGPSDDLKHFENIEYWNLGCATRRNMAAMLENPTDLVQPRAEGPVYAARRTTVLDKYRKGESSSTVYPDANKGAISDLGK